MKMFNKNEHSTSLLLNGLQIKFLYVLPVKLRKKLLKVSLRELAHGYYHKQ